MKLCTMLALLSAHAAIAGTIVYNDTQTALHAQLFPTSTGSVGLDTATNTLFNALDIGSQFAGWTVTDVEVLFSNVNPADIDVGLQLSLYADDGAGHSPGTFLGGVVGHTVAPGNTGISIVGTSSPFQIPSDGVLWAGLAFDNAGGALSVTPAQLLNFGAAEFDPPTVGTASHQVFISSPIAFGTNNPTAVSNSTGVPDLAWQITAVPEPSALALLLLAGVPLAWRARRRYLLSYLLTVSPSTCTSSR